MASGSSSAVGPRRQGSFHPCGLDPLLEGDQLAPVRAAQAQESAAPYPHSSWKPLAKIAIVLCAGLVLVGIPVGLSITVEDAGALCAIIGPLLSIVATLVVCAAWAALPAVRSAHTGQVTCLSIACGLHSIAWLIFWWSAFVAWSDPARCDAFKFALIGWVCTFLWYFPVGIDWILLMRGNRRSASGARRLLSHACHLTWLVALGLALPLVRAQYSLTPLFNSTASGASGQASALVALSSMHLCRLQSIQPTWWPVVVMAVWAAAACFSVGVYTAGMRQAAEETPRIVWARHRVRAMQLAAGFVVLQPPSAALFWMLLDGQQPPAFLCLWGIFAGAAVQGAINALSYFWNEPGALSALCCGVLLYPCSDTGCLGGDSDVVQQLHHADSRFVHFRREDIEGRAAPLRGAEDIVQRVLAEDQKSVPFRMLLMVVPVAALGIFFGLVVALHV